MSRRVLPGSLRPVAVFAPGLPMNQGRARAPNRIVSTVAPLVAVCASASALTWGCAPAPAPETAQLSNEPRTAAKNFLGAPQIATVPAPPPVLPPTSSARPTAPTPSVRAVPPVAPQSTPPSSPEGLSEYATKRPISGCFCTTERDRITIDIPCGTSTCVEGTWLACAVEGRTITPGSACEEAAVCVCKVDLDEDNAIALACGMSACANGTKITCSSDGRAERQGACD